MGALEPHTTATRSARPPTTTARSTGCGGSTTRRPSHAVKQALEPTELLIADGHHRYETARVYADEIGGEGPHRYVLMCLVALQDEGLTVFPTHRLLTDVKDSDKQVQLGARLAGALRHRADRALRAAAAGWRPDRSRWATSTPITSRPTASRSRTRRTADEALKDFPEPYRHLDTAILEALILKGAPA